MALMPKGQREQVLVFLGFLALVAVVGYWHFVYSPRSLELEQTAERIEALVTVNQKAKAELAKGNVRELRQQLTEYRQNLALIRTLVPMGTEVPALLEQVSTAARRVGLDLAAVNPQPVVTGGEYDTYRFNLELLGNYHDLAAFFTNVGSLSRIVLPSQVTLAVPTNTAAAQERQKGKMAVIEARFQIETYVSRNTADDKHDDLPPKKDGDK